MSNKINYLERKGENEPPGHTLDDRKGKPIRRYSIKRDRDAEHEERMGFGNALYLEAEEIERKKKIAQDQINRYKT